MASTTISPEELEAYANAMALLTDDSESDDFKKHDSSITWKLKMARKMQVENGILKNPDDNSNNIRKSEYEKEMNKLIEGELSDLLHSVNQKHLLTEIESLHYSINKLVAISDSERNYVDVKRICPVTINGTKIMFQNCSNSYLVVTMSGSLKMTCSEIEARSFYGPVSIIGMSCTYSKLFEWSCEKLGSLGFTSSRCEGPKFTPLEILLIGVGILSLIVSISLCVFNSKINRMLFNPANKDRCTKKGFYIMFTVTAKNGESGEQVILKNDEPNGINKFEIKCKKNLLVLFLLMLVCKPWPIQGYELIEDTIMRSGVHSYQLKLSSKEIVETNKGPISRESSMHYGQATYMMSTYDWSIKSRQTYFCQWSSCDNIDTCRKSEGRFKEANAKVRELFHKGNESLFFSACMRTTNLCVFGAGCIFLSVEIEFIESDEYKIYSLTKGGLTDGI